MARDRRKSGPTPKQDVQRQLRIRQPSSVERAMFLRGVRSVPGARCLDLAAVDDALNRLASQGRIADLRAIGAGSERDCLRWADRLAAENRDDARWDDWRSYRRAVMSDAN
jgi:hypothetical protein